ncbi:MAG TPA: AarF/UbiB family protein [Thermoanaerobaculia bacterium]|nr:AarF/UbiB family protein [Thermoanaerobaculia bacterium]
MLPASDPAAAPPPPRSPAGIDPRRFRKLRRFLARTFLQAFWHDVVLNRPLLRWARREPLGRWQRVAQDYRSLAVEMGGVLIKLGQFLSIRVDLLPPEITRELAGLQDRVPPEPVDEVIAQIEADFGRPLEEVFPHFDREPLGAASLAQVHAARLPAEPGGAPGEDMPGEDVVVKVLRPRIGVLVETDLAALRLAVRWLRPWRRIRQRVDLDRLAEEVAATTRAELDVVAEGHNAERFAADFADDPRVKIPRVYWHRTAVHTLTLENVAYIRIADHEALAAAGISRQEVARVLYGVYMQQLFVNNFVHADPHPGNLFIRPLPAAVREDGGMESATAGDGEGGAAAAAAAGTPFQIVFVDFGMVAAIGPRYRQALREYLFGLGSRDAERMIQSYVAAGVLLPGADIQRLVEVHEDLFRRFWGVRIGELREVAFSEAAYFLREYRDLLYEMPFQVQVELLFVSRAVGLLAGLATSLDPRFDPWAETIPFAEQLAAEEAGPVLSAFLRDAAGQARAALGLPEKIERVLARTERGNLAVQVALPAESRRLLERFERTVLRLAWSVVSAGLLVAGAVLRGADAADPLAPWLLGGAAVTFLWGLLRRRLPLS